MRPRKTVTLIATTAALVIGVATPLTAQWRPEPVLPVSQPAAPLADPPVLRADTLPPEGMSDVGLSVVGVSAAVVGSFGGAYLGYHLDRGVFHWEGVTIRGSWARSAVGSSGRLCSLP